MSYVSGVNLLPATGEFTYDTVAYRGQRAQPPGPLLQINAYANQASFRTDLELSIDQLLAAFPGCETVAIVCAWFFNSELAGACHVYPSTTYVNNLPGSADTDAFQFWNGAEWASDHWRVSGLTETSVYVVPISQINGSYAYGGTPSDQSIVRCIQYLKSRGLRAVFYPFLLGDIPGSYPWRGRIAYAPDLCSPDRSDAATSAVAAFLGSASAGDFSRDPVMLTVAYSGVPNDYTYRRMILHYANLCAIAGGVDLFLIGSELRGLEVIRGAGWTNEGATSGGSVTWDYPFVNGLITLADDVRSIFDAASLTKDLAGLHNLISYAADWSSWMGVSHSASNPASPNGQWPHLDQLWAHSNIDLVCFDNYLPLSDWTTARNGGQDALNWSEAAPVNWPPTAPESIGLGLSGTPRLNSKAYLKANVEGGERFNWFYFDGGNLGRGSDPNGSDLKVSLPEGDRLTQSRNRYYLNQQILGQKQIRWWWNNPHQALYDDGDGTGESPKGSPTLWTANSKSVAFTEYGFPSCDRSTNQPNVFFDAKSSESATPYWSIWDPADGGGYQPRRDQNLQLLALEAFHEYWFVDGNNATVGGVPMIRQAFCSVWNWDARPFPVFPNLNSVWGDAGNWQAGNWLNGKGPFVAVPAPDPAPSPAAYVAFPTLAGQGWNARYSPRFLTGVADHVSGRSSRCARAFAPVVEIEIAFDLLRAPPTFAELQTLLGFLEAHFGQDRPFTFPVPADLQATLGLSPPFTCRFAADQQDFEEFMSEFWRVQSLTLRTVKGE
jgi:hypothetical protein